MIESARTASSRFANSTPFMAGMVRSVMTTSNDAGAAVRAANASRIAEQLRAHAQVFGPRSIWLRTVHPRPAHSWGAATFVSDGGDLNAAGSGVVSGHGGYGIERGR